MARRLRVAVAALGAMLAPAIGSVGAQAQMPVAGVSVEGRVISLPPAPWRLLGEAVLVLPAHAGAPVGGVAQLRSQVYGWVIGDRVVALAALRVNLTGSRAAFGLPRDCARSDLHVVRRETPPDSPLAICGLLGHVLHGEAADGQADPAWRQARALLARETVAAPAAWLQVGFAFADGDDMLDLRLMFDPLLLGLPAPPDLSAEAAAAPDGVVAALRAWLAARIGWPAAAPPTGNAAWRASGWSPRAAASDPSRAWILAQLLAWYDEALPEARMSFKGRGGAMPWPWPWAVALGLAPPRDASAAQMPPAAVPPLPVDGSALWKTVSWRTLGTLVEAGIGAIAAGGLSLFGNLVYTAGYYIHELVWRDLGARGTPGSRTLELPEIGIAA
jgi:uncharacterized membrane protein